MTEAEKLRIKGKAYLFGLSVEKDVIQGVRILKEAGRLYDSESLFILGYCHEIGLGVFQDYNNALNYYVSSANLGNIQAKVNLALFYLKGYGVSENPKKAFKLFTEAAKESNKEALYNIGLCYLNGIGTEVNYDFALAAFERALEEKEYKSYYMLGILYFYGLGMVEDYEKAYSYFNRPEIQDMKETNFALGYMNHMGFGVRQDAKKAIVYYQKAINAGYKNIELNLADAYLNCFKVEQANEILSLEERKNNPDCMLNLAYYYANAIGRDRDITKANAYLEKAYELGVTNALDHLYEENAPIEAAPKATETVIHKLDEKEEKSEEEMYQSSIFDYEFDHKEEESEPAVIEKDLLEDTKEEELPIEEKEPEEEKIENQPNPVPNNSYVEEEDESIYQEAVRLFNNKNYNESLKALFTIESSKEDVAYYKGLIYLESPELKNEGLAMENLDESYFQFNNEDALKRLVKYYIEHKDYAKALYYLEKSDYALQEETTFVASEYLKGNNVEKDEFLAFQLFNILGSRGYPAAMVYLGYCYKNGMGTLLDDEQAYKWYLAASEFDEKAIFNVALCLYTGVGTEKNFEEAYHWYQRAAENGVVEAMMNAAGMLTSGVGVERNYEKAFDYYSQAASLGNSEAMYQIGKCYETGRGVIQDKERAFEYYEAAAEKSHPDSLYKLGCLYYTGQGVEMNLEKAVYWWEKAKEAGNEKAAGNLKNITK